MTPSDFAHFCVLCFANTGSSIASRRSAGRSTCSSIWLATPIVSNLESSVGPSGRWPGDFSLEGLRAGQQTKADDT